MTGLDTNVLVRYLTQDDPAQSRRANALIDGAAAVGNDASSTGS
jgi:predicted nucleic-acid-binding protein